MNVALSHDLALEAIKALNLKQQTPDVFLGNYCQKCKFGSDGMCGRFTPRAIDAGKALGCTCYTCAILD